MDLKCLKDEWINVKMQKKLDRLIDRQMRYKIIRQMQEKLDIE